MALTSPYDRFYLSLRETILLITKKIPTLGLRQPYVVRLLLFAQGLVPKN